MHQQQPTDQQQMLGSSSGLPHQAVVSANSGLPVFSGQSSGKYPGQYEATFQRGLSSSSPYPTAYGQQQPAIGGQLGQGLPIANQMGQITGTSITQRDTLNGAPSNIQMQVRN